MYNYIYTIMYIYIYDNLTIKWLKMKPSTLHLSIYSAHGGMTVINVIVLRSDLLRHGCDLSENRVLPNCQSQRLIILDHFRSFCPIQNIQIAAGSPFSATNYNSFRLEATNLGIPAAWMTSLLLEVLPRAHSAAWRLGPTERGIEQELGKSCGPSTKNEKTWGDKSQKWACLKIGWG